MSDLTASALRRLKSRGQAAAVGTTRGRDPASGLPLPPRLLRAGGTHFRTDADYLAAARKDARRLADLGRLHRDTRLLDLGCGSGRLAIGVAAQVGPMRSYCGIDVDPAAIRWANRHLAPRAGFMRFLRIDVYNARYNPSGPPLDEAFRLPVDDEAVDTVYAYSLFSHMVASDVGVYLSEISRVLTAAGGAVFTAFVEDDVPDQVINPAGYGGWLGGALHCVRFGRGYFDGLLAAAGLAVTDFHHGGETDGQSLYVVSPHGVAAPG
ncbi:MAG TPA: class I SAM-dependent methyltransferase [Egibacteraceae bacterium]|nr:class I SAM-dependent methyltransferase [Egibacteraceae bacterium]